VIKSASDPQLRHYHLMARYNHWMNRKLYGVCAQVPDELRKKDLGAFFKSIHDTLNHIMLADMAWLSRFRQQQVNFKPGQRLYEEFDALRSAREELDQDILQWAGGLSADWLASDLTWSSAIDGKTRVHPVWALVSHFFNHQTHHRGQVTDMLKQQGYEPGVTDIPMMLSEQQADMDDTSR